MEESRDIPMVSLATARKNMLSLFLLEYSGGVSRFYPMQIFLSEWTLKLKHGLWLV